MTIKININTDIEIKSVNDLPKLKIIMEVNKLGKPNFSEIARTIGVDRRTVKKHYGGNISRERKQKKTILDEYHDLITSLLSAKNKQVFYYK